MMLAPVVLFVYNRSKHTRIALDSLAACALADKTELYIFSDGSKQPEAEQAVCAVREIVKDVRWQDAFAKVHVLCREKNLGLADSVISGVSQVISQHGSVIVLEDDNRVAIDFLDYMNRALAYYRDRARIGSIGGFSFPVHAPKGYAHDVFLMGRSSSYAWGTWRDRWEKIDWQVSDYAAFMRDRTARRGFDAYGNDRAAMLTSQMRGRIDSWAIRFAYSMFRHGYMAILPLNSRVENIGDDGSGIHIQKGTTKFRTRIVDIGRPFRFEDVSLEPVIVRQYQRKFHVNAWIRVKRAAKNAMGR